ncbi:uncharacterized protein CIMG_13695 [Coccidioides immitis RS]|uniref:Uncharacterized protein n=1 Tax=Coccidioides immitis (strain RS) TaxID=246410 RepID=A0A0D8JVY3_COCIM|nr:uncharacterized protein CIMG_13695 [Coccidioides immitis RS]KJF61472.1 hypothetical protein CIMG_13695 [Coccidioides immitis RS]
MAQACNATPKISCGVVPSRMDAESQQRAASLKVEGTRSWAVIRGARKSALIYVARHPIPDARARVSGSNAVSAPTLETLHFTLWARLAGIHIADANLLFVCALRDEAHIPACTSDIGNAITTNKEANCEWKSLAQLNNPQANIVKPIRPLFGVTHCVVALPQPSIIEPYQKARTTRRAG